MSPAAPLSVRRFGDYAVLAVPPGIAAAPSALVIDELLSLAAWPASGLVLDLGDGSSCDEATLRFIAHVHRRAHARRIALAVVLSEASAAGRVQELLAADGLEPALRVHASVAAACDALNRTRPAPARLDGHATLSSHPYPPGSRVHHAADTEPGRYADGTAEVLEATPDPQGGHTYRVRRDDGTEETWPDYFTIAAAIPKPTSGTHRADNSF